MYGMRYQQLPYSCGAAAARNALKCFGMNVPERIIRVRAGTTKTLGTQELGIIKALRTFGRDPHFFVEKKRSQALETLLGYVNVSGFPVIICVQNMQHWVVVVGALNVASPAVRFIIVDSTRTKKNKRENGVSIVTKDDLMELWSSKEKKFFGIVVK